MVLRPGNAGSNAAADHLVVLERPSRRSRTGGAARTVLIRADGAGYSHAPITALSQRGLDFSVGYPVTEAVRDATRRDQARPGLGLAGREQHRRWPAGTRRRDRGDGVAGPEPLVEDLP